MRYFVDTEFIEDGKTIDLISIGIVAEDGREYYALNYDCNWSKANDWVEKNVLAHLPQKPLPGFHSDALASRNGFKNKGLIADEVAKFCGCEIIEKPAPTREEILRGSLWDRKLKADEPTPEFWADYASYDWVVLCQLFGTMMDLPAGFPMYCNDIQQLRASLGYEDIEPPKQHGTAHNALEDARYVQELWDFYTYWTDENMSD